MKFLTLRCEAAEAPGSEETFMAEPMSTIQADFDRIALVSNDDWNHNNHYHNFLLEHVPTNARNALEIGCGTGLFSRLLATRADRVLAVDLSPQMIRIAQERCAQFPNIDFQTADVMSAELPLEHFDCIATIATLHHLPMAATLRKIKSALKVNGVLLVLDLFQPEGLSDVMTSAVAKAFSFGLALSKRGSWRPSKEALAAWVEHEKHDSYLTLAELRRLCADVLPGAKIKKHLFWRYSLIWKKTASPAEGLRDGGLLT